MATQKADKAVQTPVAATEDSVTQTQALVAGDLIRAVNVNGQIKIAEALNILKLVDVADVDLLLTFTNGDHVVIANGALDALSPNPPDALFNDKKINLADLFKLVGVANVAKSGSLRLVSEAIDANPPPPEPLQPSDPTPPPALPPPGACAGRPSRSRPAPCTPRRPRGRCGPGRGGAGGGRWRRRTRHGGSAARGRTGRSCGCRRGRWTGCGRCGRWT